MKRLVFSLIFALSALACAPAHAVLYTYNYIGSVTGVAEGYDFYHFEKGDQINVSFTLDIGSSSPLASFTIGNVQSVGGRYQDLSICNPCGTSSGGFVYRLDVLSAGPQAPQTEIHFRGGDWRSFLDFPDILDPTLFFEGAVIEHHVSFDSFFAAVRLDRIAPVESVPEPSALALLSSGLLGFALRRRGRVP
jgi:MprA protease rhombosortase-interaction domain-containing protein